MYNIVVIRLTICYKSFAFAFSPHFIIKLQKTASSYRIQFDFSIQKLFSSSFPSFQAGKKIFRTHTNSEPLSNRRPLFENSNRRPLFI